MSSNNFKLGKFNFIKPKVSLDFNSIDVEAELTRIFSREMGLGCLNDAKYSLLYSNSHSRGIIARYHIEQ